jgi:hypothetical protein
MPYVKDWFSRLPELADGGVKVMNTEIRAVAKKVLWRGL